MAAVTHRTSDFDAVGGWVITSSQFTPANGDLLVVWVGYIRELGDDPFMTGRRSIASA
jgi:hypothetical protein